MNTIYSQAVGYLLQGAGSGAGTALDTRTMANYAALQHAAAGASAIVKLQASVDATGWVDVLTVTAVPATALLQLSGYYPYIRGVNHLVYSGAGATGFADLYYAGGLK